MKNANTIIEHGRNWAIIPDDLEAYADRLAGMAVNLAHANKAIEHNAARSFGQTVGAAALLPLHGPITKRYGMMAYLFGGTSSDSFGQAFDNAIRNPQVSHVVIDVDSPGGTVAGTTELANKIRNARGAKPITAVVNAVAASAAYWIASAADNIIVTPSGEVGSIGVFAIHTDISEALEKEGVKYTIISSTGSPYKTEGNPYEPLSEEAAADTQKAIDESYDMFVADVAKGRGVTTKQVRDNYGKGRMVSARDAVALGMADGIGTLEDVLAKSPKAAKRGKKVSVLRRHLEIME